jgi:hypothetical protein
MNVRCALALRLRAHDGAAAERRSENRLTEASVAPGARRGNAHAYAMTARDAGQVCARAADAPTVVSRLLPLERMVLGGVRTDRLAALRQRVHAAPMGIRAAGALVLALIGVAAPLSLLTTGAAEQGSVTAASATRVVVKEVVVERPVIERRVIRQVIEAPVGEVAPARAAAATSNTHPPAHMSAPRRAVRRPAAPHGPRDATRHRPPQRPDTGDRSQGDSSPAVMPDQKAPVEQPDAAGGQPASSSSAGDRPSAAAESWSAPGVGSAVAV